MKDKKKRVLSLLMSLALALSLLPSGLLTVTAAADDSNPVYTDGQYVADEVSMTGKNQAYTLNETLIVKAGIDYGGTGGHDVRYLARSGNLFNTDDTTASHTLPAIQNGMEITAKTVPASPATNSEFQYCLRGKPTKTGIYTFTWTEKYNNVDCTPNEPNYSCTFILKVTVQPNPYGDKAPDISGVEDSYPVAPGAALSIDWDYTPYCDAPVGYSVDGPLGRGLSFAHGEDKTIVLKAKSIDAFPSGTKWPIKFTTQYWLSQPTYVTTKEITVNNGINTAVPALKLNLPAAGEYKTRSSAVIDDSDSKGFAIYNQQWYEADGKTEQSGAFTRRFNRISAGTRSNPRYRSIRLLRVSRSLSYVGECRFRQPPNSLSGSFRSGVPSTVAYRALSGSGLSFGVISIVSRCTSGFSGAAIYPIRAGSF